MKWDWIDVLLAVTLGAIILGVLCIATQVTVSLIKAGVI